MKKLLSPLSMILAGGVWLVLGILLVASMPTENTIGIIVGEFLLVAAVVFWALAAGVLIVRLFKRLAPRPKSIGDLEQVGPLAAAPRKAHHTVITAAIVVAIAVIAGGAVAVGPITDSWVLSNADPAMLSLAAQAGMSRKGELAFLRTQPQMVSDTEMQAACADNTAANNSNGFIEQGCYVPTTNRIYIRKMPADLHNLEVSTAAYEMLHPVYISLHASRQGEALDKAIEANFVAINDAHLNAQVANFAKTEPGARDLELFSLLGTGYSNLSPDLAKFYLPYFDNIYATVKANDQVVKLFKSDQDQLASLQSQIDHYDGLANDAYATSVRWAHAGNQAKDDYYYNLYRQYIKQENTVIDQYNTLLKSYNALVTEYNGTQPVQQLHPRGN